MKTLIVYYSRSGRTDKIAKQLALKINADLEEIKDKKNRSGIFGFISSGNEAHMHINTPIDELEKIPNDYDITIIGTPIWANNISTPIRSFLKDYKEGLKDIAFFCTSMGSNPKPVFKSMEKITGRKPATVMNVTARDIRKHYHIEMIDDFVKKIKQYKTNIRKNDK